MLRKKKLYVISGQHIRSKIHFYARKLTCRPFIIKYQNIYLHLFFYLSSSCRYFASYSSWKITSINDNGNVAEKNTHIRCAKEIYCVYPTCVILCQYK